MFEEFSFWRKNILKIFFNNRFGNINRQNKNSIELGNKECRLSIVYLHIIKMRIERNRKRKKLQIKLIKLDNLIFNI